MTAVASRPLEREAPSTGLVRLLALARSPGMNAGGITERAGDKSAGARRGSPPRRSGRVSDPTEPPLAGYLAPETCGQASGSVRRPATARGLKEAASPLTER